MSKDRELRRIRMDMLRMRASLERDDVASAANALRDDAARLRGAATTLKGMGALVSTLTGRGRLMSGLASGVSANLRGRDGARNAGGLVTTIVDQIVRRPWLAALALKGLRSAKRHPGIAVAAVVGVVVATAIAKRRRDPSEDVFSAPMG
jgi:hypothetical protein